jgi:hypothetical protein
MEKTEPMERTASAGRRDLPAGTIGRTSPQDEPWPHWYAWPCAIIASGPSAKKQPFDLLRGRARTIVINESWQLCPWADVLYGCDSKWWLWRAGVPEFHGLKVSQDEQACRAFPEIRKVEVDKDSNAINLEPVGKIGAGGNSGFQALNLAVRWGTKRIMLIGFDMRVDLGEHWHPRHYPPLSNPHPNENLPRWRRALDGAKPTLEAAGVSVVNCSAVSMLAAYPKMTLEEALASWQKR